MTAQNDNTRALLRRLMASKKQERLDDLLFPGHVRILLGKNVANLPQAQLMFSFAVNLLSRLHPVVQKLEVVIPEEFHSAIIFPRWHADQLQKHIITFLSELNPPLVWSLEIETRSDPQVTLVIGETEVNNAHCVYVGSDGWEAEISPDSPVPTGNLVNPVGAYAAACIAVGEVWKRLFLPHRNLFPGKPIVPINRPLAFSCFSYRSDSQTEKNPSLDPEVNLGRITIVGLGAGGGALAFTLASLPKVQGILNLIEPDEVNLPNLNRYIFASEFDAKPHPGQLKTDVVVSLFNHHPGLSVRAYPKAFNEVNGQLSVENFRHVIAAVHSRVARREIQYETPEILWDGGATEDGDFRIWRILLGRTECMFCKHPVLEGDPEEQEAFQLSELLGLSQKQWLEKIRNNSTFSPEEIEILARRRKDLHLDFDIPQLGERYSDWFRNQCGRLQLPEMDQEIPIPFAPVMAGVLLAGEVIKERQFPNATLPHYYGNTLIGNWMRKVSGQPRPPKPDCTFCHDQTFRSQFERRWGRTCG